MLEVVRGKLHEECFLEAGEMAHWVRALVGQAQRPEFGSQNSHEKPGLALCIPVPWGGGDRGIVGYKTAPGLVRDPFNSIQGRQ